MRSHETYTVSMNACSNTQLQKAGSVLSSHVGPFGGGDLSGQDDSVYLYVPKG